MGELRHHAASMVGQLPGRLRVSTVVGDVGRLHRESATKNALFQVASQFNLLEMVGPDVTPEDGVTRVIIALECDSRPPRRNFYGRDTILPTSGRYERERVLYLAGTTQSIEVGEVVDKHE